MFVQNELSFFLVVRACEHSLGNGVHSSTVSTGQRDSKSPSVECFWCWVTSSDHLKQSFFLHKRELLCPGLGVEQASQSHCFQGWRASKMFGRIHNGFVPCVTKNFSQALLGSLPAKTSPADFHPARCWLILLSSPKLPGCLLWPPEDQSCLSTEVCQSI